MKNLFNVNGPLIQFFLTLKDFVILNFLWIIFCIPIITIGASTSALYSVTFKIAQDKDTYVGRQFIEAFKENLKQSTKIELILFIPALCLGFGLFFWATFESVVGTVISTLCIIFLLMLIGTAIFAFPLVGRYENTTLQTIRNSLYFCMNNKPYTLAFMILIAGGFALNVLTAPTAVIMCFFGYSFIAYIISFLMLKILKKYDNPQTDENAKSPAAIDDGEADLVNDMKDVETNSLLEHKNDSDANIKNAFKDIEKDF